MQYQTKPQAGLVLLGHFFYTLEQMIFRSQPAGLRSSIWIEHYITKDGNPLAQNIAHVNLETV